jgi:hypothetical protein
MEVHMSRNETTPNQELTPTPLAITESSTPETQENSPTFAERVGKKKWTPAPDPFSIATDYQIGVRLFESKRDHQMAIMFGEGRMEDKPSLAVLKRLYDAGFRWNQEDRIWACKFKSNNAITTRFEAKRLHREVCNMIRDERGMDPLPEIYR